MNFIKIYKNNINHSLNKLDEKKNKSNSFTSQKTEKK